MRNLVRGLLGLCRLHRSSVIFWTCRRCTGSADDDLLVNAALLLGLNLIVNNPPRRRIRLQRIQHLLPLRIWIRLGRQAHHTLRIAQRFVWILTSPSHAKGPPKGACAEAQPTTTKDIAIRATRKCLAKLKSLSLGISTQPAGSLACIDLVNEDLRVCETSHYSTSGSRPFGNRGGSSREAELHFGLDRHVREAGPTRCHIASGFFVAYWPVERFDS
jgi:hypothetical protein